MSYERSYGGYGGGYGGGGGGRRRNRDYEYDRRQEVYESPEEIFRTAVIRFGDVDVEGELPKLASKFREYSPPNIPLFSEALRISVTEQPYKIPHYAALLVSLCGPTPSQDQDGENASMNADEPSLGRQILDDFWKGFQTYLDKLAWRETRLCVHFFAHLTIAKIISAPSMLSLLQSFTAVLDEFGVSHGRAKRAALCAAEGLMRAGPELKKYSAASVSEMIVGIQTYNESVQSSKWLVQPILCLHSTELTKEHVDEHIDCAVAALKTLEASDFVDIPSIYPQPYLTLPSAPITTAGQFDLPSVLVPPEVIELDNMPTDEGEDALVKKEEWPDYMLRLFENDVTPDLASPAGYAVRADLLDIVDIFEINRKECARLLMEYPKWTIQGTFKPKPGTPGDIPDRIPEPDKDWQLESTIIETILSMQFILPESPHKTIYYIALITELCKLSPQTVGPAVGKSIRRLYAYLADGLDVEIGRRFAEWFSVHMSNFGFQWVWKEWIPDLALTPQHPKRVFVRRALEFEIRLSYFDRILKTLPEPFQDPEAGAMSDQGPGPEYDYDDPSAPHHDAAQSVLNQLRGRAKPEDVLSLLSSLKRTISESELENPTTSDGAPLNVDFVIRSIAIQSLLHIGSRSFSHFLNAIERYIILLRTLTGSTNTSGSVGGVSGESDMSPSKAEEARMDVLGIVATFWRRNRQMVGIVFDKLMQYQIVDPTDIVKWVFKVQGNRSSDSSSASGAGGDIAREAGIDWDLLKAAVDKANGRVVVARKKVALLRKEEDEKRARKMAAEAGKGAGDGGLTTDGMVMTGMEIDGDGDGVKPEEAVPAEDSPALMTALKAFGSLTKEQKTMLSSVLAGFVDQVCANSSNPDVISEKAWEDRAVWGDEEWRLWTTWALYKHFCRAYAPYLRNYATTLGTVAFAKIDGATDDSALLMKKIWNVAIGQE